MDCGKTNARSGGSTTRPPPRLLQFYYDPHFFRVSPDIPFAFNRLHSANLPVHGFSSSTVGSEPLGKFSTLLLFSTGYRTVDLICSAWKRFVRIVQPLQFHYSRAGWRTARILIEFRFALQLCRQHGNGAGDSNRRRFLSRPRGR
jgi:hypothetical protein